ARGELADPIADAREIAATPHERVVEVAHVLPVAAVAREILAAGRELARDRFHLGAHRRRPGALRGTEALHPECKSLVVGQARERSPAPARLTLWVPGESCSVSVPLMAPCVAGVKVTFTTQLAPTASVAQLCVAPKLAEALTALTVTAILPEFVRLTGIAGAV